MRDITTDLAQEFEGQSVTPIILAELVFDSATVRVWSGLGTIQWQGEQFTGLGGLIDVSPLEETQKLEARGISCTLSGVPSTNIAMALTERCRGRPFRMWLGALPAGGQYVELEDGTGVVLTEDGGRVLLENQLIDEPLRIFTGLMDVMEFQDDGTTASIRLAVENAMIIGERAKMGRYTAEDQKKRFPDDRGLEFINQLQDKEIVW